MYRWIFDRGTPFYDDAGNFAGFVGSCVDVHERRRGQEARQRKGEEELASARDFEKWIIAIVSHDIRNPLNAIAGSAATLLEASDPGIVKRAAERVLRGAQRIGDIVGDLLDVARERQGTGVPLSAARTDLRTICRQVLGDFEGAATDKGLDLRCEGEAVGEWDPHRLTQAISNLVGNAIEHSPAGSPIPGKVDARHD